MSRPHQIPLRTFLWEYLGHPDDETPERKRILYAIVVLRLGFALLFLLRGWSAVFATPPDAFATRLGDPARLGLSGAAVDTTIFILGCTELGIGALLLFGAFTRVSAVIGMILTACFLILGDLSSFDLCTRPESRIQNACSRDSAWLGDVRALLTALAVIYLAGLLVIVIAGSPFLSADRALDKLEEEERDRAPAVLPRLAEHSETILRAGLLIAGVWLAARGVVASSDWGVAGTFLVTLLYLAMVTLVTFSPLGTTFVAAGLLVKVLGYGDMHLATLFLPGVFISGALVTMAPPGRSTFLRWPGRVRVQRT